MLRRHRTTLAGVAALVVVASASAGGELGTRANPYPLHVMGSIPRSGGWHVRVNEVTPDASAIIATIPSNRPPRPGYRFVLLDLTFRYAGAGTSAIFQRLAFYARSAQGRTYDFALLRDSCGLVPNVLDDLKRVRRGGVVDGPLCVSVKSGDVSTLLFVVEPSTVQPHRTQVYFRTH